MKRRIYISAAISSARNYEQEVDDCLALKTALELHGYEVYLPHLHTGTDKPSIPSGSVYARDYAELQQRDIIVAMLMSPSHGVGAEIAIALSLGLKVIGAAPKGLKVSRFILGLLEHSPNGVFTEFDTPADIAGRMRVLDNRIEEDEVQKTLPVLQI